jgi:hypothetical protein
MIILFHHYIVHLSLATNLLLTALIKSKVFKYDDLGTLLVFKTQIAKSLVISPCSTASMVAAYKL